jgi:hypothetical protein
MPGSAPNADKLTKSDPISLTSPPLLVPLDQIPHLISAQKIPDPIYTESGVRKNRVLHVAVTCIQANTTGIFTQIPLAGRARRFAELVGFTAVSNAAQTIGGSGGFSKQLNTTDGKQKEHR